MTSLVVVYSVPQPLLIVSHAVHFLTECLGIHHLWLLFLSLLVSCSLVCLCITLLHWWVCTHLVIHHVFLSCGCLECQSVMNSYSPGLYSILMLYQWIHNSIICSLWIGLQDLALNTTSGLWSVITLTPWVKQ